MTVGLSLGSFALVGGRGNGWQAHLRGADQDWGNPVPQDVAIQSLLQTGAPTVTQGWDNRQQRFLVDIESAESASLAAGEAAFMAEIGIPNTLVYTPEDGFGKPTVFEVWTSHLDYLPDDLVETFDSSYSYALVLTIRPWARALEESITEAIEVPGEDDPGWEPIDAVVDSGSSTSGWSAPGNTVTTSGGIIRVVRASGSYDGSQLRRIGAISSTETQLLLVDWNFDIDGSEAGFAKSMQAYFRRPGTNTYQQLELVASQPAPTAGFTRSTYALPPATSFNDMTFIGGADRPISGGTLNGSGVLQIDQIRRRNTPPAIGTAHQSLRTIGVLGSVTTDGSLEITHDTQNLGQVVAYTWIDDQVDYLPPLRPWRLSSGVVLDDGTTVSGGYNDLDDVVTFEVPVARLPRGMFQLWGRVRSATTGTHAINWTAQAYIGGVAVGAVQSGTARPAFGNANNWRFVSIARALSLPPVDVADGSTATIRITLVAADIGGSEIDLDEALLLWLRRDNQKTGAVTYVSGAAIPFKRLRIDTPTTETPRPRILAGNAEDWTDAYYPAQNVLSWELHEFKPPLMKSFIVTDGAENAKVRLRHYPRAHSHSEH